MALLIENNAYSRLAASLAAGGTTLTVDTGTGDRFPIAVAPNYFKLTLQDAANNIEIIKVSARAASSDSMTIERAQEGTTARAWSIGDIVELRLTAGVTAPLQVLEEADTAPLIRGKIDVPTRSGVDASGSWNINSATATALQTARTINGVSFNGTANITITANTPNSLTFNNTGAGGASGSLFNGAGALTVSYNTVGAPSTTGANASGTWGINITGNAATANSATNATTATNVSGGTASVTSGTVTGGAQGFQSGWNVNGDITANRGNGSGVIYLGSATKYLYFDGNSYQLPGAELFVNGQQVARNGGGTFSINITGNAATVTNGVYNNGGTYGINITGNAATATNSTQLGGIVSNRTMQKRRGGIQSPSNIDTAITTPEMGFVYSSANAPVSGPFMAFGGLVGDIDYSCQMAVDYQSGNNFVFRTRNDDSMVWNGWRTVLHSNNYLNYSPGLTGTNASGTWGINITGNAGSAYGLNTQANASPPSGRQVLSSDSNGYAFLSYINSNAPASENPSISQIITMGSDDYYRKSSLAHVGNQLNAAGYQHVANTGGSPGYYGARAFVNFNGTGTVAIRNSQGVSSITDNDIGAYTVNLSVAMPDVNYTVVSSAGAQGSASTITSLFKDQAGNLSAPLTTSFRLITSFDSGAGQRLDNEHVCVSVFR